MNLTDYHAKYFAYELTKRCSSDSLEKLAGAVAGAQVGMYGDMQGIADKTLQEIEGLEVKALEGPKHEEDQK
ncbi:MAG: hypothetical protein PHE83_16360 [Opitutaceae bacterium]|nr:hypothetical protein [Opitutaceae bacterium]